MGVAQPEERSYLATLFHPAQEASLLGSVRRHQTRNLTLQSSAIGQSRWSLRGGGQLHGRLRQAGVCI
eukprot:6187967-Pleurochrysis_carterae.AAC.1